MIHKSGDRLPPISPARRHFMGIVAAGAGRLSALAVTLHVGKAIASNDQGQNKDNGNHYGQFEHDGNGGNGTTCFCAGTLIQTPHGEVAVEALGVGHTVMTTNGALPVKWVDRKTLRKNAHAAWHPSVLPVKVSRFAIDDRTPQRDLCHRRNTVSSLTGF